MFVEFFILNLTTVRLIRHCSFKFIEFVFASLCCRTEIDQTVIFGLQASKQLPLGSISILHTRIQAIA